MQPTEPLKKFKSIHKAAISLGLPDEASLLEVLRNTNVWLYWTEYVM